MRIVVTHRDILQARIDIAAGLPALEACPIAQSLKRRGFKRVRVLSASVVWWDSGRFRRADLPDRAREWVREFDDHQPVKPLAFEFEGTP